MRPNSKSGWNRQRLPIIDGGEYKFRFLLAKEVAALPRLAVKLEKPLVTLPIVPETPSFLAPDLLSCWATIPAAFGAQSGEDGKGCIVRVQEVAGEKTTPKLTWLEEKLTLLSVVGYGIASYRIEKTARGSKVTQVALNEK